MEYTGWCQNDFNVQGYPRPRGRFLLATVSRHSGRLAGRAGRQHAEEGRLRSRLRAVPHGMRLHRRHGQHYGVAVWGCQVPRERQVHLDRIAAGSFSREPPAAAGRGA